MSDIIDIRDRQPAESKPTDNTPEQSTLFDLETPICDLDRAARIAFLMMMREAENPGKDPGDKELTFFAVEQVERLASELRASFYAICKGEAVQS